VFVKKFGTLLDSFGMSKSQTLDDDLVDMLHKGMVGIANAWAADPRLSAMDRARAQDVMRKIKEFKRATGVRYDKNFSGFFKHEEVYTIYAWLIHAEEDERETLKWFVDELTDKKSDRDFKLISCPCSSRCDDLCCKALRTWCKIRNRPKSFFEDLDADATLDASEADAWRDLYAERDMHQAMTDRERYLRFGDVESSNMMELKELGETQQLGRSSLADGDFVKKNRAWREQGQQLSANGAVGPARLSRRSTLLRSAADRDHADKAARKASKEERKIEKRREKEEEKRVKAKTKGGEWQVTHAHTFGSVWGKQEKSVPEPEPEPLFDDFAEPRAASSSLLGSLMQKARSKPPPEVEMIAVDTFHSPFETGLFGDSGANTSRAFMSDEPSKKELKKMAKQEKQAKKEERKQEKQSKKEEKKLVKAKTKGSDWDVGHTHTAAQTARRSMAAGAKDKLKEKTLSRASGVGRVSGADPFESSFGSVGGDDLDGLALESKEKKVKKKKKNNATDDDDWLRTTSIMQAHDRGSF
jgi:hypothetical protein